MLIIDILMQKGAILERPESLSHHRVQIQMEFMRQTLTLFLMLFLSHGIYSQDSVLSVEWTDLLSQSDLEAILNPPEMSHDLYGWQEQLDNNPEATAYNDALQSYNVNPDLVNKRIMIPGFIVPTAYNEERKITEFFLVPFFGACIHLPPPPPNQIIHVSYERGLTLSNFYDAHVVHGLLTSEVINTDIADSAYKLVAEGVSIYSY